MSVRKGSPYTDYISEDGRVVRYEGLDVPSNLADIPKLVDQPMYTPSGGLTQNGKFYDAALKATQNRIYHSVRIYQKMTKGVWVDNFFFNLIDADILDDKNRKVFRFTLHATDEIPEGVETGNTSDQDLGNSSHPRIIPSYVIQEVWKRDKGQCVICQSKDNLHYDHYLPYSEGGSSLDANNIRILCAMHNLQKSNKIQ
ncbi:MAG: HNH endonuclease [Chloroflexota bacterium]|nr:HNH endonuclease [Chloroflexota bacterium]